MHAFVSAAQLWKMHARQSSKLGSPQSQSMLQVLAAQPLTTSTSAMPFGCIANHIIAKGAEKKMKDTYPQLNLLFLDADAGISEVNFFNRMHFFVNHAKEQAAV